MLLSIIRWIVIVLVSIILGLSAVISSIVGKNIIHSVTRMWGRLICRLTGVRVEVSGIENVLRDRAQIFISNHQGMYDIFAMQGYLPISFLWIAKESLFKIPIIGLAMKRAGYIGVNRASPKKFYKNLYRAIEEIKNGKSIIIFPEGTRTADGSVGKFKRGSLFLIFKTGVPVVPVTISGSFNVMKRGEFRIRSGKIKIFIDKPIEIKEIQDSEEEKLIEMMRAIIVKNLQGLD